MQEMYNYIIQYNLILQIFVEAAKTLYRDYLKYKDKLDFSVRIIIYFVNVYQRSSSMQSTQKVQANTVLISRQEESKNEENKCKC